MGAGRINATLTYLHSILSRITCDRNCPKLGDFLAPVVKSKCHSRLQCIRELNSLSLEYLHEAGLEAGTILAEFDVGNSTLCAIEDALSWADGNLTNVQVACVARGCDQTRLVD